MNEKFTSSDGCTIHAPLGNTLIHGTMRACDLIPAFLKALKDTEELHQKMMEIVCSEGCLQVITDKDAGEWDRRWDSIEITEFLEDLFDTLNHYAPEGYYFGAHPGDGSDYGYWPVELLN